MASNQRGSAILEALPASLVFFTFVSALLLIAYLLYGRALIQYRSEQALYCLAEARAPQVCKAELAAKLKTLLPFGDFKIRSESRGEKWMVDLEWKYQKYSFHFKKELTPKLLSAVRASPWSPSAR